MQEVPGSNPGGPTKGFIELQPAALPEHGFGVQLESKLSISVVGTVSRERIRRCPWFGLWTQCDPEMGSVGTVFCVLSSGDDNIFFPYIEGAQGAQNGPPPTRW